MTALALFVQQAIPHEAGHILVGRILSIPVVRLDHIIIRGQNNELLVGHFATVGLTPKPAIVNSTPLDVLEVCASYVGGGLAGNLVSRITADENALEKDRSDLKIVSTKTLEEAAESARLVINQNPDIFEKLRTSIKDSYVNLMKEENIAAGRYSLLSAEQLEEICPQNKTRFPILQQIAKGLMR
jgi:hypothetical protein